MEDLDELLNTLLPFWQQYGPILTIGLGVGALAFLVGRSVLRRGSPPPQKQASPAESPRKPSSIDRRSNLRRPGNPVDVELSDPLGRIKTITALVCDRSRGGIGLHVEVAVPVGTVLNARPLVGHNVLSLPVEVRSCRQVPGGFVMGSQFIQVPPPWTVLMLFG